MKEILRKIQLLLTVYLFGASLALILGLLKIFGTVKIQHSERFPRYSRNPELYKNGLLVIFNHPSLFEPILVPVMFRRDYLSHPFKLLPMSTPDRKNFDRWYWFWAKPSFIFIERGNSKEARESFRKMERVLKSGGIVVIPPEGTRTFKKVERNEYFPSRKGKKIGTLEKGITILISKANPTVLQIWVDGAEQFFPNTIWINGQKSKFPFPRFWKKMTVKIGRPSKVEIKNKAEIAQKLVIDFLKLADE